MFGATLLLLSAYVWLTIATPPTLVSAGRHSTARSALMARLISSWLRMPDTFTAPLSKNMTNLKTAQSMPTEAKFPKNLTAFRPRFPFERRRRPPPAEAASSSSSLLPASSLLFRRPTFVILCRSRIPRNLFGSSSLMLMCFRTRLLRGEGVASSPSGCSNMTDKV